MYLEPDEKLTSMAERMVSLASSSTVVEMGSGSGSMAFWFGRRLEGKGKVIAFDTSSRAVNECSARARQQSASNVLFEVGDVYAIPLPDSFADLVFCKSLFCVLSKPSVALNEMLRVVKPGGQILAVEPASSQVSYDPEDERFSSLSNELTRALYVGWKGRGVDQHFGIRLPATMRESGLNDIRVDCYCKSLLLSDPGRSPEEILAQLETEASEFPPETERLIREGGMSPEALKSFHTIAERRLHEFRTNPGRLARSAYFRVFPIFVAAVGRKQR